MPYKDINKKRANDRAYWLKTKAADAEPTANRYNLPIRPVKASRIAVPRDGLRIAVITDVQAEDGKPMEHLRWAGEYIARKRPDVIVNIGDFGDIPSLSRFDRGTLKFEGRRYARDIAAYHRGMELLMNPIAKVANYNPWLEYTLGNHEMHVERIGLEHPQLAGLHGLQDLHPETYGWRVHPFLQPVEIGGVAFCHYFPSGVMGRPITSASKLLEKLHMSAFAGHQPGREIAYSRRADGSNMTAIISGSFYSHSMDHLSPFTNGHWRGMWMLHEVKGGSFDEMAVSINFLRRKFK